jgi:DNA-binding transcriptional ArsR family regulator
MVTQVSTGAPPGSARKVTAAPSLACDLSWLLCVAAQPSMQARYPVVAEIFNGREELADRVREFWNDGSQESCFAEMQILAHHSGAFCEKEAEAFWQAIERAVATVPLDLDLPSESWEDLEVYRARFTRLRNSPELLAAYLQLLRDVWAPVDDLWHQDLPLIEEAGRQVVAQYERGQTLELLIPGGCDILAERLPDIVADVESGRTELLFVPCLFFGTSMYLEFPGLVVIGTGVAQSDMSARAKTESVARRIKAVADPTRLALLHSLASTPSTIGDLAGLFRLAQPTVSMHVKVLRENGLVRAERRGGRLRLSADPPAMEALLADLRAAVLQDAGTGSSTIGSERIPATVVDSTRSGVPVTS